MASGNTITNSNSSTTTWTTTSSNPVWTTTTTTATTNPYLYNSLKINPNPFSFSFSWDNKTVSITLKDGNDIFKIANAVMKLLDNNGIEYKVKTSGKRKKK